MTRTPEDPDAIVFNRCIFCRKPFPAVGTAEGLPPGRRFAYDPERGRLWLICGHCRRWNLAPLDERLEAIDAFERLARDEARIVSRTDNIALLETAVLDLVRVGRAGLAEQSWWRYGRHLMRRRAAYDRPHTRISAFTYGAMARLGSSIGLLEHGPEITWDDSPATDMLRWWHFGWAAWRGRVTCPSCRSVLRALPFDLSWWLYPRTDEDGRLVLGVPCQRCDPWTPDKVYPLAGDEAEYVLRRVLAYQHFTGASERMVRDAADAIDDAGSVAEFTRRVSSGRASLWKLGATRALALEIALNESVEQRVLSAEARALELTWRREEMLARIIDEEL